MNQQRPDSLKGTYKTPLNSILILVLLFLLFGNLSKAQSLNIDHIRFQRSTDSTSYLYNKLKIRDTSTVIIAISRVGLWTYGQYSEAYIFYPNGKIKLVEEFISSNKKQSKSYSKKYTIINTCRDSLLGIIHNNDFHFNRDSLFAMSEPIVTDSSTRMINTWDGLLYSIAVVQGNHYLEYSTTSPESIIQAKGIGWTEKRKLLELIQSFERIKNCCLN